MIIKRPHYVHISLDNCRSQFFIAVDNEEVGLSLETLQGEALHTEEVGTAVLQLSEGIRNVLNEVRSSVADGDGDVPYGGSPTQLNVQFRIIGFVG